MPKFPFRSLVALVTENFSKSAAAVKLHSSKSPFAKLPCPAVFWK